MPSLFGKARCHFIDRSTRGAELFRLLLLPLDKSPRGLAQRTKATFCSQRPPPATNAMPKSLGSAAPVARVWCIEKLFRRFLSWRRRPLPAREPLSLGLCDGIY